MTAPDGAKYEKANVKVMLDAIAAGDVVMLPSFAPEGNMPGCNIDIQALAIPVGSKNVEAAHDFIKWIMAPDQNVEFVVGSGGGFPSLKSMQSHKAFQIPFYIEAAKALRTSECKPWQGTLERPKDALELILNAVYKLIKEDPSLDIIAKLTKVQEEYNANN